MNAQGPLLSLPTPLLADVLLGPVFLFVGLGACSVAALRRRSEFRLLLWFGLFIGLFGARLLANLAMAVETSPVSHWAVWIETGVNYVLILPSLLFWIELSAGTLRRFTQVLLAACSLSAVLGIAWYRIWGVRLTEFLRFINLAAIVAIFVCATYTTVPRLRQKCLRTKSQALRIVMPVLAAVLIATNGMYFLRRQPPAWVEPIAFAGFVVAIGFEAVKNAFDKERRLFSIESELETARQIQSSILPGSIPEVAGLRIAAAYKPMSAVAGDFYHFLHQDNGRIGILVADVTGHGVPAALISSMIKVAMQSSTAFASEPAQLIGSLNRILTPELRGQLTSAAYLWMDTQSRCARYSAAGHPPLLVWKNAAGELQRIECNGLLFGVRAEDQYSQQSVALDPGDRFLLYTDGLTEPENARGEPFGERRLEQVVSGCRSASAAALSNQLLSALREWQPASAAQQDDITLVVVDAL